MAQKLKWQERFFGKDLIRCATVARSSDFETVAAVDVLKSVEVTGVYFSFANMNLQNDDLIRKLKELHARLGKEKCGDVKKFEVVQVVMWAHNDVYSDFEQSHTDSLVDMPWFAIPFSEIDLKIVDSIMITDDLIDGSTIRRGKLCWSRRDDVGLKAINHSFLLESGVYLVLSRYFPEKNTYNLILEIWHHLSFYIFAGQSLDNSFLKNGKPQLELYSLDRYKLLTSFKGGYLTFYPLLLAACLAGKYTNDFELTTKWICQLFGPVLQSTTRLSRRYRIKSGVPTLVLLDKEGGTITSSAQERLVEDPSGTLFPWRPRPVDKVLKDVFLQPGGTYDRDHPNCSKTEVTYTHLSDGIRGFYFSANWCPPCKAFTPQLADAYALLHKRDPDFEVIFVSSDRSAESFATHLENMPWLAIPWQQTGVRAELAQLYEIRGIPTLLLLDSNGHIITTDARTELAEDPLAQNFPWKPRPVNILTERYATKLHDYPAIVLFIDNEDTELQFAESVLNPAADAYYKKHNLNFNAPEEEFSCNDDNDHYLQFLVGLDNETSDILRDLIGLDDVVPLLVAIDIPNRRFAVMEYGIEITVETVDDFLERFQNGRVVFRDISEKAE